MRFRPLLSVLAVATLPALAVPGLADQADAERSSPNLKMVARIGGIGGSDIEFVTRTLTSYKAPDGQMVTPAEPVERHFALVGSYSSSKFVDITDPEKPYVVSGPANCSVGQGDVQIRRDGMLAAIARQGGSGSCKTFDGKLLNNGSALLDISDIYNPVVVGVLNQEGGSHNHTMHPDGKHLYVSPSTAMPGGPGNMTIPIWDISDPRAPRFIRNFTTPGAGPHDVRFSADGKRAYAASITAYQILNTEDPANPKLISTIVPPANSIGHDTLVTPDGAFLILGDEAGGGAPYPCPGGAIYIYDIRNETNPVLVGMAQAGGGPVFTRALDEVPPAGVGVGSCTSHVMELNPDNKSLSLGWYALGTRTFSFASLYGADGKPKPGPLLAAAWGKHGTGLVETGWIVPDSSSTWAAKQYAGVPGYIFSNASGTGGGLYVTKINGPSY